MLRTVASWKLPKPMPVRLASMAKDRYPRFDWVLRFDGGSRGNPGAGGSGAVIYAHDKSTLTEVWCGYFFMGPSNVTNNQAEYTGLIEGLKQCITMKLKSIEIQGDSQLIIRQVQDIYQCRNAGLKPLYEKACRLLQKIKDRSFKHIARAENDRADELANIAMDKKASFSYYTNFTEYQSLLQRSIAADASQKAVPKPRVKKVPAVEIAATSEAAAVPTPVAPDEEVVGVADAPTKAARKPRAKLVSGLEVVAAGDSAVVAAALGANAEDLSIPNVSGAVVKAVRKPRAKKVATAEEVGAGDSDAVAEIEGGAASEEGVVKARKPRSSRAKKVTAVEEGDAGDAGVVVDGASVVGSVDGEVKVRKPRASRAKKDATILAENAGSQEGTGPVVEAVTLGV